MSYFDFFVVGGLGIVGLATFAVTANANSKIKQIKSYTPLSKKDFDEIQKSGNDRPIKTIIQNARAQPYNGRQMELRFTGIGPDPKRPNDPGFQLFPIFSSRQFARLTFPVRSDYPQKCRLQIKNTKIQQQLVVKQRDYNQVGSGYIFTFDRLASFAILGAVGYDYENNQFYVRSFTIAKTIEDMIQDYHNQKRIAIGVAVVMAVLGIGYFIWRSVSQDDRRQRRR